MSASPARAVAHRVLRRVTDEGAFADRAFRAEADRAGVDQRERAFAQQLAYGTVQRLAALDYVLARLSDRPLDRIEPAVRDALRLGVFQLLWMGSVPDRAAVEQTVELAKLSSRGAGGFANAVMRRAAREAATLLSEAEPAVAQSHPEWIAQLWSEALGPDEAVALMARDNEPPESAVRANELRTTREEVASSLASLGVESHAAPDLPEGLVLDAPFDLHGSELFARGDVMPQSRASMLVARVLDPRPGERVLDLCAAPGAKASHIAALMRGEGSVFAVERNEQRGRELAANCERLGAASVEVLVRDARDVVEAGGFDRVLLDPPCSDLGTLQSRPDARWRKTPEQVEELSALQGELLEAAALQVRPGGTLVYSTCTISPAENERQVERFLREHAEFRGDGRFIQLLPHRDGTDGFFMARLQRNSLGQGWPGAAG
ncbi:MAG: 16S rRNA (cytosine(967)-C(5))-methyltransferase RsmB [Thermoleophilaceae bacterium]